MILLQIKIAVSVHNQLHKQASWSKPPLIRGGRHLLIFRGKLSCLGLKSLLKLGKSAAYQEYGETYAWKNISCSGGASVNRNQHCFQLFIKQKCFSIPTEEFNYIHGVPGLQEWHTDLHSYPEKKRMHHNICMYGDPWDVGGLTLQ